MEVNLDTSDPWVSILVVAFLEGFKKILPESKHHWIPWFAIPLAIALRTAWTLFEGGETDLTVLLRGAGSAGVGVLGYAMQRSVAKSLQSEESEKPKEGTDS
jgi:hypothetical protein